MLRSTGAIFISYRRATPGMAGRLADTLKRRFGRNTIFFDVDVIEPGMDFVNTIQHGVANCRVLLVVIGPEWNPSPRRSWRRQLDDPKDYVAMELRSAFAAGVRVIPVLVEGAHMPTVEDLPPDLRQFAQRHAARVNHEGYDRDVELLIKTVSSALEQGPAAMLANAQLISKRLLTRRERRSDDLQLARVRRVRTRLRARKQWAAAHNWEFVETDPVLPGRWRFGTIHQGGPGVARNLVAGQVSTPDGPRQGYLFDHEQAGRVSAVLAAVQVTRPVPAAVELRLPSAPLPDDAGLDLLEPLGERYAFVSDADAVRPLLTSQLADAADVIGDDIELVWAEDTWVLAAAPIGSTPARLKDLLADLAEIAGALEQAMR